MRQRDSLQKYNEFLYELAGRKGNLIQYGITARRYYYLAEIQVSEMERNLENWIKHFRNKRNKLDYTERIYSNGFAFYTIVRVNLEVSRALNNQMISLYSHSDKELKRFRNKHHKEIKKIIDIANDKIKHPLEIHKGKKVLFYEPGGLDDSGEITMYEWSSKDENHFKFPKINPKKDCEFVQRYLEGLAEIYLKML